MAIEVFTEYEADRTERFDRVLTLREQILGVEGERVSCIKKLEEGVGQVLMVIDKSDAIRGMNRIAFGLWLDLQERGCEDTANTILYQHYKLLK